MQIESHFQGRDEALKKALRRKQNAQVMLIGFDDADVCKLSAYLSEILMETHVIAEPYDGLAAVIDDPHVWLCCIIDARVFASDDEFDRFQTLFTYEGPGIGMILGNASADLRARHQVRPTDGLDMVTSDICDTRNLGQALKAVLFRRGFCDRNILVELGAQPMDLPRQSTDRLAAI